MKLDKLLDTLPRDGAFRPLTIFGDIEHEITGVASLKNAVPDDLAYVRRQYFIEHPDALVTTASNTIIAPVEAVSADLEFLQYSKTILLTPRPRLLFSYLAQSFGNTPQGIDSRAIIGDDVILGKDCIIEAGAIINHATLGDNVWIGAGAVIGGQGFGFEFDAQGGRIVKFPQLGRVRIGNDVEIMAHACIARGALDDTVIEDNVKIDQFVHVAHGVHIGEGSLVIAHAMIGGSSRIGRYCWIAPGTQIINKVTLGDFAMTGVGAIVIRDVEFNALVVGNPARKLRNRFEADDPSLLL
jgi:UDP-3-O-[3-hydroxymyristoyl] glucosamine N-acyltransferase